MNEQNNGLTNVQNPQQPAPAQPTMQAANVAQPVAEAPAPQQPVTPAPAPVTPSVAPAPVAPQPVPTPTPAPAPAEPAPVAVPATPAPVAPVAPTPTPIATPAQPIQSAPAPAASPAPAAPTDIVASAPLNPIAANATVAQPTSGAAPQQVATPAQPNSNGVGFVANGAPLPKKKKTGLIIAIVAVVVVVLVLLGVFVLGPAFLKASITPKAVYETTIKAVSKEISTTVTDVVHDKAIYEIELNVDSNMDTISAFSGYTYGVNAGIDPTNKALQMGLYMKNSSADYSMWNYIKDGKQYSRYSTDDMLNYLGEVSEEESNELFASFKEALESQANADDEDLNYLVEKVTNLLIESIDESKLSQEETTLTLNEKSVKVLNNKYTIDEATLEATTKHLLEGLKKDEKAIKIIATLSEVTEEEVKTMLTYEKDEETEDEEEEFTNLIFNIYTTTKAEAVGFALTDDKGNNDIHYYATENYFEFEYYEKTEDEETNKDIENVLNIVGIVRSEKTNVTIKYNKETIATAVINKNTDTEFDLDYEVNLGEGQTVTGSFKSTYTETDERIKTKLEFSMQAGEQSLAIGLSVGLDWTSEVSKINTGNAQTVTEEELAQKQTAFMASLTNTPIGMLFQTMSGDNSAGINDYYEITTGDQTDISNDVIYPDNVDDDEAIIVDSEGYLN